MYQAPYVAISEQTTAWGVSWFAVVFAEKLRNVIRSDRTREADVSIRPHRRGPVAGAVVVKRLRAVVASASDVAEVDVSNVLSEAADCLRDSDFHGCKCPLAKTNGIGTTRNESDQPFEVFDRIHDSILAKQCGCEWTIRVHAHCDSRSFGDGN